MFLERRAFVIKPGCMEAAIGLCKADIENKGVHMRLYTAAYGPFSTLLADTAAESQAGIEMFWADWFANADAPKFLAQWSALEETGGKRELWQEQLGTPDVATKFIERRTFTVKSGRLDDAIRLIKAEVERPPQTTGAYVFTAVYGSFDTLVMDMRADDPGAIEKSWAAWEATPDATAFLEKWSPLILTGKRELWMQM